MFFLNLFVTPLFFLFDLELFFLFDLELLFFFSLFEDLEEMMDEMEVENAQLSKAPVFTAVMATWAR